VCHSSPILLGNSTTPTKVSRLCRLSDIPFRLQRGLLYGVLRLITLKQYTVHVEHIETYAYSTDNELKQNTNLCNSHVYTADSLINRLQCWLLF